MGMHCLLKSKKERSQQATHRVGDVAILRIAGTGSSDTTDALLVFHSCFVLLLASFFHSDFPTRQETWLKATLSPHRHNCRVIEYKWTMARLYIKIELTYHLWQLFQETDARRPARYKSYL